MWEGRINEDNIVNIAIVCMAIVFGILLLLRYVFNLI
jgi:hypothetical protein